MKCIVGQRFENVIPLYLLKKMCFNNYILFKLLQIIDGIFKTHVKFIK